MGKKSSSRGLQLCIPYEPPSGSRGSRLSPAGTVSQPFQLWMHGKAPVPPCRPNPADFPIPLPHTVELHFMRHGESVANAEKLVTGTSNVPLTAEGVRQAKEVGKSLSRHYDAAFTSTLLRSQKTLMVALRSRRIKGVAIQQSAYLDERRLGEIELKPSRPIPEYSAGDFSFAPPGGENYQSVTSRCLRFLSDIAHWIREERHQHQRKIQRILICTHMGPLRILAGILTEESDPAKVLALSFRPTEMFRFNWTRLAYPKFQDSSIMDQRHSRISPQPSPYASPTGSGTYPATRFDQH